MVSVDRPGLARPGLPGFEIPEETWIAVQIGWRKEAASAAPGRRPLIPRRCVIDGNFAWLGRRYRRFPKNFEYLAASQENATYLTTIMLSLRRAAKVLFGKGLLTPPPPCRAASGR
jgi:hypothetical protein